MAVKPEKIRVHTFIDTQNLYSAVRDAFKYKLPNFDPVALSREATAMLPNRALTKVHMYTGIHSREVNPFWHDFWMNKLRTLEKNELVHVFTKPLVYRDIRWTDRNGKEQNIRRAEEKGIDLRMGLDLVRLAVNGEYDVAIIFSQDNDLEEAINEVHAIRQHFDRWIYMECAFPDNPERGNRGIRSAQWRIITKEIYEDCIDERDYRPYPTAPPGDR